MKLELIIHTNRMYFEQWNTGSGDAGDDLEICQAWQEAIFSVIEGAGMVCRAEIGTERHAMLTWRLCIDNHLVAWQNGLKVEVQDPGDVYLELVCPQCDTPVDIWDEIRPLVMYAVRYARTLVGEAIIVAEHAAYQRMQELRQTQAS